MNRQSKIINCIVLGEDALKGFSKLPCFEYPVREDTRHNSTGSPFQKEGPQLRWPYFWLMSSWHPLVSQPREAWVHVFREIRSDKWSQTMKSVIGKNQHLRSGPVHQRQPAQAEQNQGNVLILYIF